MTRRRRRRRGKRKAASREGRKEGKTKTTNIGFIREFVGLEA